MEREDLSEDRAREILNLPVPRLPYYFANGSVLESIDYICNSCRKSIPQEDLRGEFKSYQEFSASLDGYAICEKCKLIMPIAARVRDNGTMLVRGGDNSWTEIRYARRRRNTLLIRLWQLLLGSRL